MSTTPPASGYSGTPLAKKLGIKAGSRVWLSNPPPDYLGALAPLPGGVVFVPRLAENVDLVQIFTTERAALHTLLARCRERLQPDAVVWVSWPKKASKVATDITEDTIREVALPMGWVDVKVCAVDAVWSGLKLVVRKALR